MGNKIDVAGSGAVGSAQIIQAIADPHAQLIAASLGGTLGLTAAVWSYFSDKRNKELFDSDALVARVLIKCERSDDFASFIFDVWQKHNLESSEARRQMLKNFLECETHRDVNEYENFSKIEFIIQNTSLRAIKLLSIIHSDVVQKRKMNPNDAVDKWLNLEKLAPLVQSVDNMHSQDIEYVMNELASFGLVNPMYGRVGGTFYIETKLGFQFMEYIKK